VSAPILQFGTGRFLQAHVDLFVSQALERGAALGAITVVQGTDDAASSARLAAFARGGAYPVALRGRRDGRIVDECVMVHAVHGALHAARDWPRLRDAFVHAQVVVSNTADRGYRLDPADDAARLERPDAAPRSFPARLLALLDHRRQVDAQAPLTLYPCELIARNGDTLREQVLALACAWRAPEALLGYIAEHCVWVNSLVDRIVSAPLQPLGAVAEPYALWAIERQPRMVLPCTHPDIVVTDALARHERLKLMLLNLGHSYLAERWRADARPAGETVLQAMNDAPLREALEALWRDEVLPVFVADGEAAQAQAYLGALRERLLNPYLEHRLADIANDHDEKKRRRFTPVIERAEALGLEIGQPRLRAALAHRG